MNFVEKNQAEFVNQIEDNEYYFQFKMKYHNILGDIVLTLLFIYSDCLCDAL